MPHPPRSLSMLCVFFAGALALSASPAAARGPISEDTSRFGFAETITKLQARFKASGWKVITIHDLQASMKKQGHKVLPVKVLVVCHPRVALKVLRDDAMRLAAAMMPCRVAVYTKKDGKTYISRADIGALAPKGSPLAQPMAAAVEGIEKILRGLIIKR